MRKVIIKGIFLAAALSAAAPAGLNAAAQQFVERPNDERQQVAKKVRKALVTLPFYGVFDNLEYRFEEGTVILSGQVVRPTTRDDAERRVARIRGVERVVNNIEVLPLSGFDDSIRARTARAIFNTGGLGRYALGANPSIHIIVNRGHVTLEGGGEQGGQATGLRGGQRRAGRLLGDEQPPDGSRREGAGQVAAGHTTPRKDERGARDDEPK